MTEPMKLVPVRLLDPRRRSAEDFEVVAALYVMVTADGRNAKVGALEKAARAERRLQEVARHHLDRIPSPAPEAAPMRRAVVTELEGLVLGPYGPELYERWAEVEHLESATRLVLARRAASGQAGCGPWQPTEENGGQEPGQTGETGPVTTSLRLRPPRQEDQEQFSAAQRALAEEGFAFCFNFAPEVSWATRLERLDRQRRGEALPDGVLQEYRRRGYASEILRQSLVITRALGVERVLITCDDDNAASAAVIERCGGVLDSIRTAGDGHTVRRYWID